MKMLLSLATLPVKKFVRSTPFPPLFCSDLF